MLKIFRDPITWGSLFKVFLDFQNSIYIHFYPFLIKFRRRVLSRIEDEDKKRGKGLDLAILVNNWLVVANKMIFFLSFFSMFDIKSTTHLMRVDFYEKYFSKSSSKSLESLFLHFTVVFLFRYLLYVLFVKTFWVKNSSSKFSFMVFHEDFFSQKITFLNFLVFQEARCQWLLLCL